MRIAKPFTRGVRITLGSAVGLALVAGVVQTSPSRQAVAAAWARATEPNTTTSNTTTWVGGWGTAVQPPVAGDEDSGQNWSKEGFRDHTVRQVVRVGVGGTRLRIRLSNVFGTRPLRVDGATVGRSAGGALVWPDTLRKVTFGGSSGTVIPPGREAVSDAVPLSTSPLERLTVNLRFTGATGPATFHRFALDSTYRADGDHLSDIGADAFTESTGSWYFLSGIDVDGGRAGRRTVVVLGDSLVDGVGTTSGADRRVPDGLAERLAAARRPYGVVNAGVGTGKLLRDSPCGGQSGVGRFRRDVLGRPGVRAVIVHLGANDIGAPQMDDPCVRPNPKVSAKELIDGHRRLIREAHAHGIKAIGTTILPMKGALFPIWSQEAEKVRRQFNTWVRTSGEYDAVLDVDRVMADPADPSRPRPGYVFMDGLHPNDAGALAIAAAVNLNDL
jgi:lysophospholipase L1-like esterase